MFITRPTVLESILNDLFHVFRYETCNNLRQVGHDDDKDDNDNDKLRNIASLSITLYILRHSIFFYLPWSDTTMKNISR